MSIKSRFNTSRQAHHDFKRAKKSRTAPKSIAGHFQNRQDEELEAQLVHLNYNDLLMNAVEPRTRSFRPTSTGSYETASLKSEFSFQEHNVESGEVDRTDLRLFVESLSKSLGNSNFGLSFDFEDLNFQPKKRLNQSSQG
jgi:hypothetical protein